MIPNSPLTQLVTLRQDDDVSRPRLVAVTVLSGEIRAMYYNEMDGAGWVEVELTDERRKWARGHLTRLGFLREVKHVP